jgi:lysylphosphatidylglycerol synthase-like protein
MKRGLVAGMAVIGTALFAYSINAVGLAKIQDASVRVGWGFGAILLLSGAREVVRTLAWTHTIEGPVRLSFRDAFRARLAGEAFNSLLPMGMLVGEPMKAEHVGHRLPFATAFTALAVELAFYGASLVLLFSAGAVALFPSSAVLFLALMALVAVPLARDGSRRRGIVEPTVASFEHVANVIGRLRETLRRLGGPVLRFASLNPGRAWRLVVLEAAFQFFAVSEVYLTLALITPQHVAWSSAVVLETVSRGVTILFKMLPMRLGIDEAGAAVFADRLGLGSATGITLALVRRMRLLCWSAVGIVFVLMRSIRRSVPNASVEIASARP